MMFNWVICLSLYTNKTDDDADDEMNVEFQKTPRHVI